MIAREDLETKFKFGDKLNPLQLYCMMVGVFEQQNFHLLNTIQQAKRADFEAGRIYQNTDTGELHVIHFPGKNRNDDEFISTPRLSDILTDVETGAREYFRAHPELRGNKINRHFPVSETRKNLEHYVYVNATNDNPFNVFDSMWKHRWGVFNKKETKKILLKNDEAKLTDSDVKYRNWQDPLINDWQCGYYALYHLELFLNRLQDEKINSLDPFKGTTISGSKKKQGVLSHFNELYQLGAGKLEVKKDYSQEPSAVMAVDDDDWGLDSDSENEADIVYASDEEVKDVLKKQEVKASFWRRHPVLTAALIGGGIALAGIVAIGIVVATGGAGTPVIGGFITAAVGLIDATLGVLGVAGTIAAGIGAGAAAIGLTAGIAASGMAIVNGVTNKLASKSVVSQSPGLSTTAVALNRLTEGQASVVKALKREDPRLYEHFAEHNNRDDKKVFDALLDLHKHGWALGSYKNYKIHPHFNEQQETWGKLKEYRSKDGESFSLKK